MITDSSILVLQGVPSAATIEDLPDEVTDDTITLKWSEPQNNGKVITQYTVYQRIVTDGKPGEWTKLKIITDVSVREFKVELEGGKVYEFVVTATNEFGESLKEDGKFRRVQAPRGMFYINSEPSFSTDSLQNRRTFLRILGQQRRARSASCVRGEER